MIMNGSQIVSRFILEKSENLPIRSLKLKYLVCFVKYSLISSNTGKKTEQMYTIRLLKPFRRLRVWLLSCKQMQKSGSEDNNLVKWKGIPRLRGYALYYFLELFCLFMIELFFIEK